MAAPTTELTQNDQGQTRRSLLLGIAIWFLHQNTLNALTSVACKWGWLSFSIAGIPGLQFTEMIISLIAALTMLYMIYLPWQNWRSLQSRRPAANPRLLYDTEQDSGAFLAFIAMLMNCLFLLFIVATFVPMLALWGCGQA